MYGAARMRVKNLEQGSKIREARKGAKLSHDRLGAAVGTSRQHLIRLEQGWHRPGEELLARIAEATGRPLHFFQVGEEVANAPPPGEAFRGNGASDRAGGAGEAQEPARPPALSVSPSTEGTE